MASSQEPSVMRTHPRVLVATLLVGLSALVPIAASAQSVGGEALKLENAKREAAVAFKSTQPAPAATLRFQPLATGRIEALQRANVASGGKRLRLGVDRKVADEASAPLPTALAWTRVAGGRALRLDITSPDAVALRVGLDPRGLPEGAELRVTGAAGDRVTAVDAATMGLGADGTGTYWSPVTQGDTQRIELFLPADAADTALDIVAVSHFIVSPFQSNGLAKALGSAGACNIDVACRTGTLGLPFINAKNAVALMVFQDNGPVSCSGTLLNDSTPATQVPYFYSAAHCFNSQAIASTVSTFWNFETPTCGVSSAGANTQFSGGADLLFGTLSSDALFLRLRGTPPAGVFFAGWNASTLTPLTPVIAIHHPLGDNKKVSRGNHSGFQPNVVIEGENVTSTARASWAEGTTERGSSGSGLFTLNGPDYQLRGGLAGGAASCANTGQTEAAGNVDYYSRFDQVFPSLRQWLGNAVGPTRDHTGAWFVPTESGWGLAVYNIPGQLFALFFVYDSQGRPTWYQFQGPWTGQDQATASLLRVTGPAWSPTFDPNAVNRNNVIGSATITFTSATSATLTFNDGTVNRTVTLTKI
jgi:hypothetical protein